MFVFFKFSFLNVAELLILFLFQNVKNTLADIDMPLDTFTTDEKFAQLHALPGNVFDNVALSGNMVRK